MRSINLNLLCLALSLLVLVGTVNWSTAHAQRRRLPPGAIGAQESRDRVLKILPLRYVKADVNLVTKLSVVLQNVALSVDERTNSLIVQADREELDRLTELISALDVAVESRDAGSPERDRQVRIVWLMSGLEDGGEVPEDLQPIVEELSRYGVAGLELMTQTIVRGHDQFTTTAHPDLQGQPVVLEISGKFLSGRSAEDDPKMELSLSASTNDTAAKPAAPGAVPMTARRPAKLSLAQLETTVVAPGGHPVVLCMAPVKKMTSVFILQVILPPR